MCSVGMLLLIPCMMPEHSMALVEYQINKEIHRLWAELFIIIVLLYVSSVCYEATPGTGCFCLECDGSVFGLQLMDWDEHIMLISHTVNVFGRNLLVIGNTGSNSTREALHATEQGFAVGMHGSLQINPYYGKTSVPGVLPRNEFGHIASGQQKWSCSIMPLCCLFKYTAFTMQRFCLPDSILTVYKFLQAW